MANITDVSGINPAVTQISKGGEKAGAAGEGFGDLLKQTLQNSIDAQHKSEQVSMQALAGKADMTEVLQATTDAEMALKMVLAVKDKLVQFHDTIMRTNI